MEKRVVKTITQKMPGFARFADVPKTYRELCELYLPRPIHDEVEDSAATGMMNALAVFTQLNADQMDYLDVLVEFVEAYDKSKAVQWPKIKGLDVLKHLLAEHEMTAADLARLLKVHRTLGGMILRGERKLTLNHVRVLAKHFGVSADWFC
jgi:antitoxin component HigA of HigAB toxin-antitoxin module